MSQTIASPPAESRHLQRRLAALRRRLRLVVLFRGFGWLLAAVLLSALVAGALDWRFHLPSLVRAFFLVATLSAAGYLFYRYLFLPLGERVDDLALALRVEEHHGNLNDALASTVEFLQEPADSDAHGSPGLRREAVRRALGRIEGCDFNKVVDGRGVILAGILMLVSGLLAAAALFFFPTEARTAMLRLANPFGGAEWPKQTLLEIETPRERIGKNEAFEVRGWVSGVIPDKAVVVFQIDGAQIVEHSCDVLHEEGAEYGKFSTVMKPDQVQRKVRFQVRANDALSKWYEVSVLQPPVLVPLNGRASPQVRLTPPTYTELPVHDLPEGTGDLETVAGTSVLLRAAADRPLARAWIEFEPEPWFTAAEVEAQLSADRRALAVNFWPRITGRYILHIEDDVGLRNSRLFDLQVHSDPSPVVRLDRPSELRDLLRVLPTAELPLQAVAEDPLFAVRSVWLEYRVRTSTQGAAFRNELTFRVPLFDPEAAAKELRGIFASLAPLLRFREKRIEINQRLSLAQLPGVKLQQGDTLILQVCADDFDDITFHKQPGRSHEVSIHIVNRDALDFLLTKEQEKVQQELQRLKLQEEAAIKNVAAAQARLKELGKLDAQDAERLQEAEKLQEQIRERIGARRQEGLRRDVGRIQESLKNNDIPRSAAVHDRMKQVNEQLERLAREELEQIESRLSTALKQSKGPEERQLERQRQAQFLERLAEEKEKEAKEAERLAADRPEGDPIRGTLQKGAKFFQQQAQELRQTAQALRQGKEEAQLDREKHARLLEEMAQEKQKDAAKAQQLAEKQAESDPKRAMLEEEARQAQQQAQDLKQMAQEQRQGQANENNAKETLAEARKHQEEVDKTLADLLSKLAPFASTAEIKGDARTMLQEQRRLQEQTAELNRQLQGDDPKNLQGPQKAELEQMKEEQRRLAERAHKLLKKMEEVMEKRLDAGDTKTAQELQAALDSARKKDPTGSNLTDHLKGASDSLNKNQLNQASRSQQQSVKQMENLVKQLEDRREAELDRLQKRLKELEKQMDRLTEDQELLQKKIKEAAAIADPQKREEMLKKLAREQEGLQKRAKELEEQMRLSRMERAAQEMANAGAEMQEAVKKLERGQNAEDPQEEALNRLDEARRELEQARKEVEDELAREQLAKIADQLKNIKERHERMMEDQGDLQKRVSELHWTRGRITSLRDLAKGQKDLAGETRNLAEDKLGKVKVLAHILDRTAQAMDQASQRADKHHDRMQQRFKDATPQELVDGLKQLPEDVTTFEQIAGLQKEALHRLNQLLEAIKEELAKPSRGGGGAGGGGDGGDGGGGGGPGDAIPPLAQLKLLRTLQAEVNQQTETFHKNHPDLTKLNPQELAELQAIERDQRQVSDLLEELIGPAKPEGGRP